MVHVRTQPPSCMRHVHIAQHANCARSHIHVSCRIPVVICMPPAVLLLLLLLLTVSAMCACAHACDYPCLTCLCRLRVYHYYLPVFFWVQSQMQEHRARCEAAGTVPAPPLMVRL